MASHARTLCCREQPNAIASAKYLFKNKFKASNSDEHNITKKTFLVSLPKNSLDSVFCNPHYQSCGVLSS
jgi:hypothetical protein